MQVQLAAPRPGLPSVRALGQFVHQGSGRGEAYMTLPLWQTARASPNATWVLAAVVDGDNAIPVLEVFMAGQFDLLQE